MNLKIAVVDDNSFLTRSVKEKLAFFEDITIKHSSVNGADLLAKLQDNHNVDVILMDIEMPVMNGIEATLAVKQKYPQIKVIMLTVFDDEENIFNAIRAGADGYLLKDVNPEMLYNGIQDTLNGGAAMTPSIALKALKLLRNPIDIENLADKEEISLSEREIGVLEQLCAGLSYTVIANNLFLSPSTVRKHIANIYKKLQVHNKLEALQKAKKHNLI